MAQYFEVHPLNPQPRLLKQAAQILENGGVAAIPTDSSYALACHLDDKAAVEQLRRLRAVDQRHHLTLLCRDLSELASYARVDNRQYRLLSWHAGPVHVHPRSDQGSAAPRLASVAADDRPARPRPSGHERAARPARPAAARDDADRPGESEPMNDPVRIRERFEKTVQAIVDAGACPMQPTTVIDLTADAPLVVRLGRGDPAQLGLSVAESA
jgi:Putative translation factor (SUA5)